MALTSSQQEPTVLLADNLPISNLAHLLQHAPHEIPEAFWLQRGLPPILELNLHIKIVACQASTLGHLLSQKALKLPYLRRGGTYEGFASRLQSLSASSLDLYMYMQLLFSNDTRIDSTLSKSIITATHCLKVCTRSLRIFGSFCLTFETHPGIKHVSWGATDVQRGSEEFQSNISSLDEIINIAEKSFTNSWINDGLPPEASLENVEAQLVNWSEFLEGITVTLKYLLGAGEETIIPKARQRPRNVERECLEFIVRWEELPPSTEQFLFSSAIVPESPIDALFVSHNNSRPKKMQPTSLNNSLILSHCSRLSQDIVIHSPDILLVTQRSSDDDSLGLTLFWHSELSKTTQPDVQYLEIFLETVQQKELWRAILVHFLEFSENFPEWYTIQSSDEERSVSKSSVEGESAYKSSDEGGSLFKSSNEEA